MAFTTASSPRPARALQLTERDRALLAFASEHRFVLAAQMARLLCISTAAASRRLGALRDAGLVRGERKLSHDTTAFRVTRAGLAAGGGDDLPLPRPVEFASYRHDVGVAWLTVAAHRGAFGELSEIVGERRMRSEDGRADRRPDRPLHGVRLGPGPRERPRLHYPDLTVVTAGGHRVAFELELSTKEPARRERILAAYGADPRIDVVVYLVNSSAAGRAIERSAARVGARSKVQVQRFAWAGGRAPGEAPVSARRHAARRSAVEVTR